MVGTDWTALCMHRILFPLSNMSACHLQKLSLNDPDIHAPEPIPMDDPADYCEAWPMLPLSKLAVAGFITPLVLQSVAKTTQITSLCLHCEEDSMATLSDLAAALQPLKLLSVLDVRWNGLDYAGIADAVSSCFNGWAATAVWSDSAGHAVGAAPCSG